MSTQLDWSQLEGLEATQNKGIAQEAATGTLDWSSLEGIPDYEAIKPLQAPESFGKSAFRTAVQPGIGALQMTAPAIATDIWQLLGTGEALDELRQWQEGREAELRKKFPTAPWPDKPVFDEQKYLEALSTASKTIPTIGNITKFIEEKSGLPLEAKTMLQRKLRLAGSAAKLRPGSITDKLIAGGVAGTTSGALEAAGLPEWAADIGGLSAPGFAEKIIPTIAQKPLVDFARKMRLTEKQIAPAIQSAKKQRLLAGIAEKGKKTQEALQDSKTAIGNIFDNLKSSESGTTKLSVEQAQSFADGIASIGKELPFEARQRLFNDALELAKDGFSGDGLINFWQDINYYIQKGDPILGKFKEPIEKALFDISPSLGKNFKLANELYGNVAKLKNYMSPTLADQIVKGGKFYKVIGSVLTGNIKSLGKTLATLTGISSAQRLASNLLINPRYQNLFRQMIKSLSTNKKGIALKIKDKLTDKLEKEDPKVAQELKRANL